MMLPVRDTAFTEDQNSFVKNVLGEQRKTIIIKILDIIHRPVFYLKLNSTLQVCQYLTGNILRLRYESNRLMLSMGL
jgi:hypothetical protein